MLSLFPKIQCWNQKVNLHTRDFLTFFNLLFSCYWEFRHMRADTEQFAFVWNKSAQCDRTFMRENDCFGKNRESRIATVAPAWVGERVQLRSDEFMYVTYWEDGVLSTYLFYNIYETKKQSASTWAPEIKSTIQKDFWKSTLRKMVNMTMLVHAFFWYY